MSKVSEQEQRDREVRPRRGRGPANAAACGLGLATLASIAGGLFDFPGDDVMILGGVVVVLVTIWPFSTRGSRILAALMAAGSAACTPWAGTSWTYEASAAAGQIVAFLVAAQLLGVSLRAGTYDAALSSAWARLRMRPSLSALCGGYLTSWVIMFTSMPLMYAAVVARQPHARPPRTAVGKDLGILLARAYSAAAIATPMGATVLVALAVTGVPLGRFLLAALPLSLFMVPFCLMGLGELKELDRAAREGPQAPKPARRVFWLLLGMFAGLAAVIAAIVIWDVPVLAGVALGVLANAALWGWLGAMSSSSGGLREITAGIPSSVRQMADGSLLVLTGSFMGTALTQTPLMDALGRDLTAGGMTLVSVVITVLVVVGLRLMGMPPPAIVLVADPVLVRTLGLPATPMAVLLIASSTLGFLISPSSLTSAVVSSLTGWSPVGVSLSRQLSYVLVGAVASVGYVMLIS